MTAPVLVGDGTSFDAITRPFHDAMRVAAQALAEDMGVSEQTACGYLIATLLHSAPPEVRVAFDEAFEALEDPGPPEKVG